MYKFCIILAVIFSLLLGSCHKKTEFDYIKDDQSIEKYAALDDCLPYSNMLFYKLQSKKIHVYQIFYYWEKENQKARHAVVFWEKDNKFYLKDNLMKYPLETSIRKPFDAIIHEEKLSVDNVNWIRFYYVREFDPITNKTTILGDTFDRGQKGIFTANIR